LGHAQKMINKELIFSALPIYHDWPKKGINYLNTVDICTNTIAFHESIEWYYNIAATNDVDYIFAADARGFIWGSIVAYKLGIPLHVVRKKGKLPGDLISREYELEYGTDTLELRKFTYKAGSVLVVDDVLATGGTAEAICKLIHELDIPYKNITVACLLNISFLPGKQKLRSLGVNIETLIDVNE
jgi:adenine phosphoribosyltransferase